MKLKKLKIQNLRNVSSCVLQCGTGIHFVSGDNGQGKTTLLEGIHLLSNLRSFREYDLTALIQRGFSQSLVSGVFELDGFECELKVELDITSGRLQKRAYVNNKLVRSVKDYYQQKLTHPAIQFHAISLNPASTELIHGEAALRRNYLNQCISVQNPEALEAISKVQRLVEQKNALLKSESMDLMVLESLNEGLIEWGAKVRWQRLVYLAEMAPFFDHFLSAIAPTQKVARLCYELRDFKGKNGQFILDLTGQKQVPDVSLLRNQIREELAMAAPKERARQQTCVGPHRDQWSVQVLGLNSSLSEVGSQGEVRSVLLALKLAELECFTQTTKVRPVFLIDDFSSELDSSRRGYLLKFLEQSDLQVFVTSTEELSVGNALRFRMKQGSSEGVFD